MLHKCHKCLAGECSVCVWEGSVMQGKEHGCEVGLARTWPPMASCVILASHLPSLCLSFFSYRVRLKIATLKECWKLWRS